MFWNRLEVFKQDRKQSIENGYQYKLSENFPFQYVKVIEQQAIQKQPAQNKQIRKPQRRMSIKYKMNHKIGAMM